MEAMVNECEDNFVDVPHSKPDVPMKLGLEFDYDDESFPYYNESAGAIGFSIRKEHALKIFDVMNIKETIPSHYILKRWTKVATVINPIEITKDKEDDPVLEATKRYRHLCPTFV
ncbi:unnamed protein product [Ilex paraguariensis]|uniref:Protein FAR1-RELATED SEQUENCE n=1 Tax=Ilex paraguariensis TaxID=185542 RepID=A0ABC8SM67_9AQUA